jgi:SAM-dependent methyltransferase
MAIHGNLYDYPRYYDIAYSSTTEAEGAFYYQIFDERLPRFRRALDLGCGGGRVAAELARAGISCVGVDSNLTVVNYVNEKAARESLDMVGILGDMVKLAMEGPFDAAFCGGDTIKYIIDADDMRTHFVNVANVLASGGLYAVDTSLVSPPDVHSGDSGKWMVVEGNVTIYGSFVTSPVNREKKTERIRHELRVVDGAEEYVLAEEADLHAFSLEDYKGIIEESRAFEIECCFGGRYDPRETITPDENTDDVVILMRKL